MNAYVRCALIGVGWIVFWWVLLAFMVWLIPVLFIAGFWYGATA